MPAFDSLRSTRVAAIRLVPWLMVVLAQARLHAGDEPSGAVKATPSSGLASVVSPIIDGHKGKVAVAIKHLGTGESFTFLENEVMPTASLIKFPVMIEAYRQSEAKEIDLSARLTLRKEDKVPGSGILTYHMSDGATFPLRDAIRFMIAFSDNTATNLVLDSIGLGATAVTMERMGYPNTKIHSKVFRRDTSIFPDRSKLYGLGSTTAAEMVRLCEAVHRKSILSPASCEAILEHLRACEDKDKFPRFLPAGTKVAFKTGSLSDTRTAAGIIECPAGPVALCVLSYENDDKRWVADNAGNRLCALIARGVYDYFDHAPPAQVGTGGKPPVAGASR